MKCVIYSQPLMLLTHSLTAALDQLRVVASSTSNDPGPRSRQHQQIGQCLLPLAAANFSVNDPAGASSQQREECRCGLLLTVAVPAKQVRSPVGDMWPNNEWRLSAIRDDHITKSRNQKWRHQLNVWSISVLISVTITYIWTKFDVELKHH